MNPPPAAHALQPAAALADGEALAERLATMTHDLLAAAGADRRLVWTNPAWQPTLGWTPQELSAASYHSLVHPEDLPRVEEQLRAADERYRAITGATRDGIVSADGNGKIIFFNPGAEQVFGRSADEALGRPLTDLMPGRYRDAHSAGIARFLATGESRVMGTTIELEGVRADGSEFPLELSLGSWSRAAPSASPPSCATSPTACARAERCGRPRSASPARSRAPPSACCSPPPTGACCASTARCAS